MPISAPTVIFNFSERYHSNPQQAAISAKSACLDAFSPETGKIWIHVLSHGNANAFHEFEHELLSSLTDTNSEIIITNDLERGRPNRISKIARLAILAGALLCAEHVGRYLFQ